jgi:Tfp pilus assembly protein PilX
MTAIHRKLNEFLEFNRGPGRRGIAIYLAAVTLMIVLAVALGISLMSTYQLKGLNEAGDSVIAFAAAETGIEYAELNITSSGYSSGTQPVGTASYNLTSFMCGPSLQYLCFRSIGIYNGTERAIQVHGE